MSSELVQRDPYTFRASVDNVGIYHFGLHIGVAQKFLHRPDIETTLPRVELSTKNAEYPFLIDGCF